MEPLSLCPSGIPIYCIDEVGKNISSQENDADNEILEAYKEAMDRLTPSPPSSSSSSSSSLSSLSSASSSSFPPSSSSSSSSSSTSPFPLSFPYPFPLRAIYYAEFDNTEGPKIMSQYPPDFLSTKSFDAISDFVITNEELCYSIITIANAFGYKILGLPLYRSHSKYGRNRLMFHIGFVFDVEAETDCYHAVLYKLGYSIEALEIESELLFRPTLKRKLTLIFSSILQQLNAYGQCSVCVNPANTINLKLFPYMPPPEDVQNHMVPVFVQDPRLFMNHAWDLTVRTVVTHIDGMSHVQQIIEQCVVEAALVKKCLQQLLYFDIIVMIDIFQFSNVYVPTKQVFTLYNSPIIQESCIDQILLHRGGKGGATCGSDGKDNRGRSTKSRLGSTSNRSFTANDDSGEHDVIKSLRQDGGDTLSSRHDRVTLTPREHSSPTLSQPSSSHRDQAGDGVTKPTFLQVFKLYSMMQLGMTVGEFSIKHNLSELNIDIRRLCVFGVLNGLIRRVHKFPVFFGDENSLSLINNPDLDNEEEDDVAEDGATGNEGGRGTGLANRSRRTDSSSSGGMVNGGAGGGRGRDTIGNRHAHGQNRGSGGQSNSNNGRGEGGSRHTNTHRNPYPRSFRVALHNMLDGRHCYDEICCTLRKSYEEINSIVRAYDRNVVISK